MIVYRGRLVAALTTTMMALTLAGCDDGSPAASASGAPSATAVATSAAAKVDNPGCLLPSEKVIRFPGGDATLPGVALGTATVGIIFAHQTDGGMCQWIDTARVYASKGYRTLVFDFGGYRLARDTNSPTTTADVLAAAAYLKTVGVTRVALVGASFGGAAVVTAAANPALPVAAVVSLSGTNKFDTVVEPVDVAGRLTVPLFCAAAKRDSAGSYETVATKMCPATGPGPRQLVLVEGNAHGVELYEGNSEVKIAVDAFIAKYAPAV